MTETITFILVIVGCGFASHHAVRYLGWMYPEYHRDDLVKLQSSTILTVIALIVLIIEMANT